MTIPCKHPEVRVVAREDDAEFVECQSCREVFDSIEYRDMAIEEEVDSGAPRPPASRRTQVARRV